MFSPSSSATAFSRSPSPPTSTKFFGLPSFTFSRGSSMDEENGRYAMDPGKRVRGGRKRRRRLVVGVVGVLVTVGVTGWWLGYGDYEGFSRIWQGTNRYTEIVPPGIVIGQGGTFPPLHPLATPTTPFKAPYDLSPPCPLQTWGLDLSSTRLLSGLKAFPPNPEPHENQPPLSPLGHFADDTYLLGPITREEYRETMLNFAEVAFPKELAGRLREGVKRYMDGESVVEGWRGRKKVWQTDKDEGLEGSGEVKSWKEGKARDEGWRWDLMTDREADRWIKEMLGGSRMEEVWNALPSGILRSDALRYLLLLLEGGIYTDTDTDLLKSPSQWGQQATLFRDGAGWVDDASLKRIAGGEAVEDVLGEPSVVVGLEADVGGREDWNDWWPRPVQIVQWTMASAPYHPIALNAMLRILHATAKSVDWAHEHEGNIKALKSLGRYKDMQALRETTVLEEPKMGGSVGVMAWTGPGVWTDAVLSYLRVEYGLLWTDLKDISVPLRVGDVVILPVTGFSPGVGNFDSQPTWHKQAMIEHKFRGSWKPKEEGKKRRR